MGFISRFSSEDATPKMVHILWAPETGQHPAYREVYRGRRNWSIQHSIHGGNILFYQDQATETRGMQTYMQPSRSRNTRQDQRSGYNPITYFSTRLSI